MRLIDSDAFKKWLLENSINEREEKESRQIGIWIDAFPTVEPDVPDTNVGDMISRQDAIESLIRESTCDGAYGYIDTKSAVETIRRLPYAEQEIIRCKDCKHAHLTYGGECKHCNKWTDEFGIPEELYLDGDFYCGFAKRREDE